MQYVGYVAIGLAFISLGYFGIINRDSNEYHASSYNRGRNTPVLNLLGGFMAILVGMAILALAIIPLF